jgi:hypothetical protein
LRALIFFQKEKKIFRFWNAPMKIGAGKKGKGLGKGIFARPRFPIFSPPKNFVFRFTKSAAFEICA